MNTNFMTNLLNLSILGLIIAAHSTASELTKNINKPKAIISEKPGIIKNLFCILLTIFFGSINFLALGFELPRDTLFEEQKQYLMNKAKVIEAWQDMKSFGAPEIVVAVIDEGFDIGHPPREWSVFTIPYTIKFLPKLPIFTPTDRLQHDLHGLSQPLISGLKSVNDHSPTATDKDNIDEYEIEAPRGLITPFSQDFPFSQDLLKSLLQLRIIPQSIFNLRLPPEFFIETIDTGHPDLTEWRDRLYKKLAHIVSGLDPNWGDSFDWVRRGLPSEWRERLLPRGPGKFFYEDIFIKENAKIVHPWDFIRNNNDPRPDLTAPGIDIEGEERRMLNHGTVVASIAVGRVGGGKIVGAAPNAKLMPIRANVRTTQHENEIAQWFNYATGNGADVVIMNFIHTFPERGALYDAIKNCATRGRNGKGCVIVTGAGHFNRDISGPGGNSYATHPNIIAVSAINQNDQRYAMTNTEASNFGEDISICAPGAIIWSAAVREYGYDLGYGVDYYKYSGTTPAAALVGGIAALVLSVNPLLESKDVKEILQTTARKVGGQQGHSIYFGYGCVDALAAVQEAKARR